MGLLDELRQQSDELKSEAEKEQDRQARLRHTYLEEINPRLIKTYRYLKELVDHLNYIKLETTTDYELPVYGKVEGYKQGAYRITADNDKEMTEINLGCICQREKNVVCRIERKADVDKLNDFLFDNKVKFHCKKELDEHREVIAAYFTISNVIPITFNFKANIEASNITLGIANFAEFGVRSSTLKPNQLDDRFLDRLGNYILRKEREFLSLEISDEERDRIREQVLQEKKRLEEELRLAEKREQLERDNEQQEKSFMKLFKKK